MASSLITAVRREYNDGTCTVYSMDGTGEKLLFRYYTDELSIDDRELIGLTAPEAQKLKRSKDIAYLRS